MDFDKRYKQKLLAYKQSFRIEDINDANDKSLLEIMLRTEVMIDDFQEKIQYLMEEDAVSNASNIKKLADLLRDATATITTIQKTLAIDRKTRQSEETASVADYIRSLKLNAADFLEKRLIKISCPHCKVLVGRFAPVHSHTAFTVSIQCSQCGKSVRAQRVEKDVMFDVRDNDWRKKYRAEIIQPKLRNVPDEELYTPTEFEELVITSEHIEIASEGDLDPVEINEVTDFQEINTDDR